MKWDYSNLINLLGLFLLSLSLWSSIPTKVRKTIMGWLIWLSSLVIYARVGQFANRCGIVKLVGSRSRSIWWWRTVFVSWSGGWQLLWVIIVVVLQCLRSLLRRYGSFLFFFSLSRSVWFGCWLCDLSFWFGFKGLQWLFDWVGGIKHDYDIVGFVSFVWICWCWKIHWIREEWWEKHNILIKLLRQKSKTGPLTFSLFHFSHLIFNFCQCGIPLELN